MLVWLVNYFGVVRASFLLCLSASNALRFRIPLEKRAITSISNLKTLISNYYLQ